MKIHRSFRSTGEHTAMNLQELCQHLRQTSEMEAKKSIRLAASLSEHENTFLTTGSDIYKQPGDDCAAIATENGYDLLAIEGMLPEFVNHDPKAAGLSSVMANVSDIAAMGGRAKAVVNAFWHQDDEQSLVLLESIKKACHMFGVSFAGGHSSIKQQYSPGLAVAILGHAKHLLSCHHIRPGQRLFLLCDLNGQWHGKQAYWDCTRHKTPEQIQQQWQVPAELADAKLAVAAKDISNGGILGTLLMMLELTHCGASIDLNALPYPGQDFIRWLRAFQSFGFLLAVDAKHVSPLIHFFQKSHLTCCPIGEITDNAKIRLNYLDQQAIFWDLNQESLTNMGHIYKEEQTHAIR